MNLLDSHIEAGQALADEDKRAYYTALIEYLYYGKEPELEGALNALFIAIKPTLDNTRAKSEAGSRPKTKAKKTANKTKSNAEQNANKPQAKAERNANEEEKEEEEEYEKELPNGSSKKARFAPPSPEEVAEYAATEGLDLDHRRFCDFYASKGWKVGSSPMKDWRAAARNWARRDAKPKERSVADEFAAYA